MTIKFLGLLLASCSATTAAAQCFPTSSTGKPDYGIVVQSPKVYDDYFLETQLQALKARLSSINAADQTTLLGKIGQLQGASLSQTGLTVQALGPAPPGVTTLAPPTSLPGYAVPSSSSATAASPISVQGAYGTTTTSPTLTPTVPSVAASNMSLPSSFAPSSLDTLNEEMQLAAQITNYELLLDGALNDRYIPGSQQPKKRITVGLNISIEPCQFGKSQSDTKHLLKDHLAEIEIEVQDPNGGTEKPSIVTLLPRDKTYNVASLSDKSVSLGAGGVLGGVFNIGGNWLWHKQRYYLVEQQDTIAIDESNDTASKFAWQLRPVLGQDFISAGTRQNFVQFSIPENVTKASCTNLIVKTHWRKLDLNTGIIGAPESENSVTFQLPYFDLSDPAQQVTTRDIGGGLIDVRITGTFQDGMSARIGGVTLSNGSPQFSATTSGVEFIAAAKDLITGDAFLINRDGSLEPVRNYAGKQPVQCGAKPAPVAPTYTQGGVLSSLAIEAYSDTQALVSFTFKENQTPVPAGSDPRVNPILVSIGGKVFGTQGTSFRTIEAQTPGADQMALWKISTIVPTSVLETSDQIYVQRLFIEGDSASVALPLDKFPKSDLSVSGVEVVSNPSKSDPDYELLLTGAGLSDAVLSSPSCATVKSKSASYMFVLIPDTDCKTASKALVLTKGNSPPVVIAMPKLDASSTPSSKPPIDPLKATVQPGAAKVSLSGSGLDQIKTVRYGKIVLPDILSLDKKTADVALSSDITATEGIRYLDITTADSKHYRFELTVKKP